ncbi:unnamed protein product [Agarophyton chilense]
MDEDLSKKIPRYNARHGEDFTLWTMGFEALLESKELLKIVRRNSLGEDVSQPVPIDLALKISKARIYLVQCLGDKPLRTIATERKNPYTIYQKFRERYATVNAATRVQLQTKVHNMKYVPGKTMSEFVDEFESFFNRLKGMCSPVEDSMQVAILLSSFGNMDETVYGAVISALQSMPDAELTWERATARLLQEFESQGAYEESMLE